MTKDEELELEFLRFFYEAAGPVFGPAEDDVYRGITEDFENETGREVPKAYLRD